MINLLVITTLFPNCVQKRHGIFVETRLRHLLASGKVSATVIAPVPWFPINSKLFPEYSSYSNIPVREERNGLTVYHPRYLVIPKIGMLLTPFFMAISLWAAIRKLRRDGLEFDLVDGHYFYPDGVAIALVSSWLKKPFTITARGTDINLIPKYFLPREMILWAADKAAGSITVCAALKDRLVELGADESKINVLRNGVDLDLFRVLDKSDCRQKYGLHKPTLLSVGHLIDRKGHDLVIKAMAMLPDYHLLIVGDGERESDLKALVQELDLEDHVEFLGARTQSELVEIYSAVDIMVLASSREGWANVLLESMACGTPVVASDIWGTPEVVATPAAGLLFKDRTPDAIADSVQQLMLQRPERQAIRSYAEMFSWDETTSGLLSLFGRLVA